MISTSYICMGPTRFPVCSPYGQYMGPLWVPIPPIVDSVGTAHAMPVLVLYRHVYWIVTTQSIPPCLFIIISVFNGQVKYKPLIEDHHDGKALGHPSSKTTVSKLPPSLIVMPTFLQASDTKTTQLNQKHISVLVLNLLFFSPFNCCLRFILYQLLP